MRLKGVSALFLIVAVLLTAVSCSSASPTSEPLQFANPAAAYCSEQGGEVDIRQDAGGGEVGFCKFDDGSECDEWALFRGECGRGDFPASNQLANPAAVNCTDQGGAYEIREHDDGSQYGACKFDDGSECDAWAFLRDECRPGDSSASNQLANPAAVNCTDQGGAYEILEDEDGCQYGVCKFDDGSKCDAWAFFRGDCLPGYE